MLHKKTEINFQIASKNSTAIFTHHFNIRGYRTHWQECALAFCVRSAAVGERNSELLTFVHKTDFKKIIYPISIQHLPSELYKCYRFNQGTAIDVFKDSICCSIYLDLQERSDTSREQSSIISSFIISTFHWGRGEGHTKMLVHNVQGKESFGITCPYVTWLSNVLAHSNVGFISLVLN